MKPRYWQGVVPAVDNFFKPITDTFVDGVTVLGPWALMNPDSFRQMGRGLGQGLGQKYQRQSDGRWLKVEG